MILKYKKYAARPKQTTTTTTIRLHSAHKHSTSLAEIIFGMMRYHYTSFSELSEYHLSSDQIM